MVKVTTLEQERAVKKNNLYTLIYFYLQVYVACSIHLFSLKNFWSGYNQASRLPSLPILIPIAQIGLMGSVYCTVALALERFLAVCYPFLPRRSVWVLYTYVCGLEGHGLVLPAFPSTLISRGHGILWAALMKWGAVATAALAAQVGKLPSIIDSCILIKTWLDCHRIMSCLDLFMSWKKWRWIMNMKAMSICFHFLSFFRLLLIVPRTTWLQSIHFGAKKSISLHV